MAHFEADGRHTFHSDPFGHAAQCAGCATRTGSTGDGPTMTEPTRASLRNADGYDSGRIHLARPSRMVGYSVLSCDGRAVETYRLIAHDIGPTCKRCKAAGR
jgi:hypothetical protein